MHVHDEEIEFDLDDEDDEHEDDISFDDVALLARYNATYPSA